jgi:hypothetical protein
MNSLQRLALYVFAVTIPLSATLACAQTELEKKLEAQYELTKATADRTDIVTEGSLLVLKKDGLVMDATTSYTPMPNIYRDGLSSTPAELVKHKGWLKYVPGVSSIPGYGSIPDVQTRKFVAGEKLWVTIIHVQDDGVIFELFSNPIFKVRYYADLKFPIAKGSTPDPDAMLRTIGEVFQVQPAEDSGSGANKKVAAAGNDNPQAKPTLYGPEDSATPQTPAPEQPMKPIPPPPPPPETAPATPKLDVGWTKEQVTAVFGLPAKIVPLDGGKEIDYYPDFKLTFVDGKVTKIQEIP